MGSQGQSEAKQQADQQRATEAVVQASMWQPLLDEAGLPLLPDEQPIATVRDSLYDLIALGEREERLISTSEFLRLQQVK
ncbi:MAG: HD domain-containing protein, partial [Ktedonobacteraceae bacterium]|nr:HD domain-containing protein [Ktedonobacteraceae bacterium]